MNQVQRWAGLLMAVIIAVTALAGCSQNSSGQGAGSGNNFSVGTNPGSAKITGTVTTDGSTSMENVIGALGEAFQNENSGVTFTYNPHRFRLRHSGRPGGPLRHRPFQPQPEG